MKPLVRVLCALYPQGWRRRYGREFAALVEDVGIDWRTVLDVLKGAIVMRVRSGVVVFVACALAGLAVGALWSLRLPALYAATATVRMQPRADDRGEPAVREVQAALDPILRSHPDARRKTTVELSPGDAVLRVSYAAADAAEAQRVTNELAMAIAAGNTANVIAPPELPTSATRAGMWESSLVGGLAGALAGVAIFVIASRRSRPHSA
jgi:hypothetical protein